MDRMRSLTRCHPMTPHIFLRIAKLYPNKPVLSRHDVFSCPSYFLKDCYLLLRMVFNSFNFPSFSSEFPSIVHFLTESIPWRGGSASSMVTVSLFSCLHFGFMVEWYPVFAYLVLPISLRMQLTLTVAPNRSYKIWTCRCAIHGFRSGFLQHSGSPSILSSVLFKSLSVIRRFVCLVICLFSF